MTVVLVESGCQDMSGDLKAEVEGLYASDHPSQVLLIKTFLRLQENRTKDSPSEEGVMERRALQFYLQEILGQNFFAQDI